MLESDIMFNYMNESGEIKQYKILDKFSESGKDFIIYQEEGKDDLYADLYEIIDDKLKIIPIQNDEDYDMVDRYLESL